MTAMERTDVLVIGSGFGGAIPAYHLATGGARVVVLERGPHLTAQDFAHDLRIGSYTRIVDLLQGDGITVVAGNCVGGSSVVYFAASLRAPGFVFERKGGLGRRLWPASLTRASLDPWYDRVEEAIPVARQGWDDVPYPGGLFAAACTRAGRTCNPVPVAVDLDRCTNCNWMLNGCHFDAKRSMLLNYLPAATAAGAEVRALHEVQAIAPATTPGYRYRVAYNVLDADDYRVAVDAGTIEARVVVVAAGAMATPVLLRRSAALLGTIPRAVGRHFSGNGDRVSIADVDEAKVHDLLGLERTPGVPYQGFPIGKPIGSMSYDRLDPRAPEFTRFSLQQIYFPGITNLLAQATDDPATSWFGLRKKELRARWRSWLSVLAMTEDDNEGSFGAPPVTGSSTRVASSLCLSPLTYRPTANTLRGWAEADAEARAVLERDGLASVRPWSEVAGSVSAHPLSSCRIGDDPATSALDDRNELRGHPGLFVTDASAVPTSLCVNPSLTVAALAERACPHIVDRAAQTGVPVRYGAPAPDGSTAARRTTLKQPQESGR
jgi:choline dehydrogenase-like flavoprotein